MAKDPSFDATMAAPTPMPADPDATLAPGQADAAAGSSASKLADASASEPAVSRRLQRGDTLGRYVVLDRLGEGGMGVVYAAYDPELDRRVAIKLVKLRAKTDGLDSAGRSRLLREAQAMARLNHPNVVAVYDVGTLGDSMFVAMELVDGETLTGWLERRRKAGDLAWREVVELFVAAGRGLVAAHSVDIVHRDFKPDNVMIAADGRVLVLDFGLAREEASPHTESQRRRTVAERVEGLSASVRSMELPLTATGSMMGTPAFMSPEQFAGDVCTPASDQFSYCVSLYDALYGQRPFAGKSLPELARSVLMGEREPPPRDRAVPSWLARAVMRGLEIDPGQRYESMSALLAELGRDRARRRNRVLLGVGSLALVGISAWGAAEVTAAPDPCAPEAVKAELESVWGAEQRSTLQQAFARDSKDYTADTTQRTEQALDDYASEWTEQRGEACRAGKAAGPEQIRQASLFDSCLDQSLARMGALVRVFAEADATMVVRAPQAVERLERPRLCAEPHYARSAVLVPDDPAQQEQVEALRLQLAEIQATLIARPDDEAREAARRGLERARSIGFEPVLAEALSIYGRAQAQGGHYDEAQQLLEQGRRLARVHALERVELQISRSLLFIFVHVRHELALARWLQHDIEVLVERQGNEPLAVAWTLVDEARIQRQQRDYADSIVTLRKALELFSSQHSSSNYGPVYDNLALSLIEESRYDEAAQTLEEADAYAVERLGPAHPIRGNFLVSHARVEAARNNTQRSIDLQREALGLFLAAYGPHHPNTGAVHNGLGLQLDTAGQHEESVTHYRKALEIMKLKFGPEHRQVGIVEQNLGNLLRRMGRAEEALPLNEAAYAKDRDYPGGAADTYEALDNVADTKRVLGRCDEAVPHYQEAIELRRAAGKAKPDDLAYPQLGIALCDAAQGRADAARAGYERLIDALVDHKNAMKVGTTVGDVLAAARFALAMTLDARRDAERVTRLSESARAMWTQDAGQYSLQLRALEQWQQSGDAIVPVL